MNRQLLKVRLIEGQVFFAAPDGSVVSESSADNESLSRRYQEDCVEISQTEYWLRQLEEARRERDRNAIEAILNADDMVGIPEGWINL